MRKPGEPEQIMGNEIRSHSAAALKFDELYSEYKKSRFSTVFAYGRSKIHDLLLCSAKMLPVAERILDVGCGTGEQIHLLRQHGLAVYGLEPAEKMRVIAKNRNPGTDILGGSALKMPFKDGSFDMVLAVEVLRYLHPRHQEESLDEIRRVLKPSGIFFATLVSRYSLDDLVYYNFQRVKSHLSHSPPLYSHFTTPRSYGQLLLKHGFKDIQWHKRMSTLLRIVYLLNRSVGQLLAPKFERFENRILRRKFISLFCGHLVVIAGIRKGVTI